MLHDVVSIAKGGGNPGIPPKSEKRDGQGVRHASQGVWWGASDSGESPWRHLQERAQKIQGDKKHDPELAGFSHDVIASRSTV